MPNATRFGAILIGSRIGPVCLANLDRSDWWHYGVLNRLRPGIEIKAEAFEGDLRLWFGPLQDGPAKSRHLGIYLSRTMPPRRLVHQRLRR